MSTFTRNKRSAFPDRLWDAYSFAVESEMVSGLETLEEDALVAYIEARLLSTDDALDGVNTFTLLDLAKLLRHNKAIAAHNAHVFAERQRLQQSTQGNAHEYDDDSSEWIRL
jgi:hypothetical protein